MTDFTGLLYFWLILGFLTIFCSIQIWALDFLLDKLKNKFDIGRFSAALIYLFIIWVFGGELIVWIYLFNCLTE